jgi:hypothetical protein
MNKYIGILFIYLFEVHLTTRFQEHTIASNEGWYMNDEL